MMGQTVDEAISRWAAAGFKPNKLDVTVGPQGYIVQHEDVGGVVAVYDGQIHNCNSFSLRIGP